MDTSITFLRRAVPLCGLLVLGGCATAIKPPLHLAPGFEFRAIEAIELLPVVDVRVDKTISVNLEKQIRAPVARDLTKKGYRVSQAVFTGEAGALTEEDLKEAKPEWVRRLGSSQARWIVVMCLVDVRTKLTFGSTGNAEVTGYLFDRQEGTLSWRDKGIGQVGQGGLLGMMMKSDMDNSAISAALGNVMASFPKRKG